MDRDNHPTISECVCSVRSRQLTCKDNGSSLQKYYSGIPINSARVRTWPQLTETNGNGGEIMHCPAMQQPGQLWPQVKSSETFEALRTEADKAVVTPPVKKIIIKKKLQLPSVVPIYSKYWSSALFSAYEVRFLIVSTHSLLVSFTSALHVSAGFLSNLRTTYPTTHNQPLGSNLLYLGTGQYWSLPMCSALPILRFSCCCRSLFLSVIIDLTFCYTINSSAWPTLLSVCSVVLVNKK